uniref:ATP synthase subunit a n=1 Tax=Eurydice pulchra TaxID=155694 RepID=E3SX87_EURPU|nr:ATP synthase F0 subunit 6 [Eurydice pulchra]
MMTNLFSIFDPSCSVAGMPLNWVSLGAGSLALFYGYWVSVSRGGQVFKGAVKFLEGELAPLVGQAGLPLVLTFSALFVLILFNNSMGLLPYVFTASSHLVFTLSLALPLWVGLYLYGWVSSTLHMLAHLVPLGTPGLLMPFMVVVEGLSNLIRPITLAVRLAANMIAGHLLLALMSGAISIMAPLSAVCIATSELALLILEVAVAMIQAYVFAVLCTLYASEV